MNRTQALRPSQVILGRQGTNMSKQNLKYKTQWAAQFYVAAELTRRGFLVSLTFGNAPVSDLLVRTISDSHFSVDVKGQSTRNFWLIQRRQVLLNHYFILVYLPDAYNPPEYYIMSSAELMKKREEYKESVMHRGKYRDDLGGINWSTALQYKDNWDILPSPVLVQPID